MPKKAKKSQGKKEFKEAYLEFLAKIAQVREKQFLLMKEISQKVDAYKLSQIK